jgi:hypothetical protein
MTHAPILAMVKVYRKVLGASSGDFLDFTFSFSPRNFLEGQRERQERGRGGRKAVMSHTCSSHIRHVRLHHAPGRTISVLFLP